jgi:hypothetical protein
LTEVEITKACDVFVFLANGTDYIETQVSMTSDGGTYDRSLVGGKCNLQAKRLATK